jgi:predicted transcriptional regulator
VQYLQDWQDIRAALALTKVPHYTTVQKAQQRLVKKGLLTESSQRFSLTPARVA